MIAVKIRAGLTPASRRRVAAALGLALAAALMRAGSFEAVEVRAWRGVPDAAQWGEEVGVEIGRRVRLDAADSIAGALRRWDGVTLKLRGRLGGAELGVEIDVYAGGHVPVRAGITSEEVDVLAEPCGHAGGEVVESFYELFDVGREMAAVVEEFTAEMHNVELEAATRTGTGTYPLWRLAAWVYALRDYVFEPESTIPLWLRPWLRQMPKYLYGPAPPAAGLYVVVRDVAPELLKLLEKHYRVKLYGDAIQLIPPSTGSHREAVAALKAALAEAMKAATLEFFNT